MTWTQYLRPSKNIDVFHIMYHTPCNAREKFFVKELKDISNKHKKIF